jgi:hypothetical protein
MAIAQQLRKLALGMMLGGLLSGAAHAVVVDTVTGIGYQDSASGLTSGSPGTYEYHFDLAGPTPALVSVNLYNMQLTGSNRPRLTVFSGAAGGTMIDQILGANGTVQHSTMAFTTPFNFQDGYRVVLFARVGAGDTGSYTIDIAPIPEPSEWAMLVAGLALIGFVASRRKQKIG